MKRPSVKPELLEKTMLITSALGLLVVFAFNLKGIGNIIARVLVGLTPFYIGFAIAYVLNRPINWLEKKIKLNRTLLILSLYILWIMAVYLSFNALIPQMLQNGQALIDSIQRGIIGVIEYLTNWNVTASILTLMGSRIDDITLMIGNEANKYIAQLSGLLLSVTALLLNLFFGIVISIYMLIDKNKIMTWLKRLINLFLSNEKAALFIDFSGKVNKIFSRFITGLILEAFVVGVLAYLVMSLMGIRYALLLAVIIMITDVVPYIGPLVGALPAVLTTLTYDPIKAFWLAIAIIVIQQIDANYIGPKIMGDLINLDPIWVIFSITVGASLWGVIGIIIGIPLGAIIKILVDQGLKHYEGKKIKTI